MKLSQKPQSWFLDYQNLLMVMVFRNLCNSQLAGYWEIISQEMSLGCLTRSSEVKVKIFENLVLAWGLESILLNKSVSVKSLEHGFLYLFSCEIMH